MIQSYGCDQKGRRLGGETEVKQVSFQVFPEGCDRGTVSSLFKKVTNICFLITDLYLCSHFF